jgi:hypothetical protein
LRFTPASSRCGAFFASGTPKKPGPNRVLAKVGFLLVKRYRTTPRLIDFEQEVNQ